MSLWKLLTAAYDSSGNNAKVRIDPSTSSLQVVNYAHHEVHAGSHFVVTDIDTDVDIASPKYWHIITPDTTKWVHLLGSFYADGAGLWEFYENPTTTDNGTALTAYNNNRNSGTSATAAFYYDPTVSSDGTKIWSAYLGAYSNPVNNVGGSGSRDKEFVLKQNEQYLVKFTPAADDTLAGIELDFYEHTDHN